MADSSFDVVSEIDRQEADNALNQAAKEVSQRYDFRGTDASVAWSGEQILIIANTEDRALAVLDVLQSKMIKRGISLKSLDSGEHRHLAEGGHRQGGREEDRQDRPRRGSQGRQDADPGRRDPHLVEEPRRPAGGHRAAQEQAGRA
jgi:hypothetical protein